MKNKLKKLHARMTSCHKDAQAYLAKAEAAESAEDKTKFMSLYRAKVEEFDDLKGQATELKALISQESELESAKTLIDEVDDDDVDFGSEDDAAAKQRAKTGGRRKPEFEVGYDPERDEMRRAKIFMQWAGDGPNMDGEAFEAIRAKDEKFRKLNKDAVMLPPHMVQNVAKQTPYGAKYHIDYQRSKVILSTDSTGGSTDSGAANLLAPDFRPQLLTQPVVIPTLYDFVRVIPAVNGSAEWPMLDQGQGNFGGVAFTWKTVEGADKGETEPVFKDFTVQTHELSGWTEMSLTALRRSAIDLEITLTQLYRDAIRHEWSKRILLGAGASSGQPVGLIGQISTNVETRTTLNKVQWVDLVNMEYAISQGNRLNARWVMDDSVEKFLKTETDADGKPLFAPDVHSQIRRLLAGYPYTTHEFGPSLNTSGDIVFGNFQNYAFAMEEDIAIARSDHAEFKKGRVVFRLICFVGGKPIYENAFSKLSTGA